MSFRSIYLLLAFTPGVLAAQDSSNVKSSADHSSPTAVTFGVTSGSMGFADQRTQEGVTAVARYRFLSSMSVAVSPTYAHVSFPSTLGGGSVSGLTDLPIELDVDHSFDQFLSPTIGLALGTTLPVGDRQTGFGSGAVGANVGAGIGLSPNDALSLHVGVGKPLTDYSASSALGSSGSAWSDVEIGYQLSQHVNATLGYDGDLSTRDSLGAARAVALSIATTIVGPYTLTMSGGHGVSGPAARWTFALGFGTDFAGLEALGSSSPIQRFFRAMGGSSSSHRPTSSPGSGHGKAP
jgi:hypothetical protein